MKIARPMLAGERGFTLLEVLISLVVLSVGLLGIAAMVSVSMKSNYSSYQRTQASALAYAILDRMRANRTVAENSGYDIAVGATTAAPPSATGDCTSTSTPCSTAQIAALDLTQWKTELANILPSGDGSIATAALNQMTQVTITVQWNDSRAEQATTGAPSSSTSAPLVFTVVSGL